MTIKDQILQLRGDGLSYRQIEKQLGCSRGLISYHLGSGQREKTAARTQKHRDKHLSELKIAHGGCCKICRYDKCLAALHFHHVDPTTKLFTIGAVMRSRGWKALAEEAKKCILLCANCHAEHHNCPDMQATGERLERSTSSV